MNAHARRTDPETSHQAAASVSDITDKQFAVLVCLRATGPVLYLELINAYEEAVRRGVMPAQSESGIRSRRHELVEEGMAKSVNRRPNSRGRLATVWQAL